MAWMAPAWETREYLHFVGPDAKDQAIGEMPEPGSARVLRDNWELAGILRKATKQHLVFDNETRRDARPLPVVPIKRGGKLGLCR